MTYRLHVQLTGYRIARPYGFNRSSAALTGPVFFKTTDRFYQDISRIE
uniref:Uncharacterized protein n=1 Tax=Anguilla anguilla TaxID=7936 RepID=A0A0E9SBF0_ANGAN